MPEQKTIVFVINSLAGGGAERVLSTLLSASGPWRDRYRIHLVLLDDEPGAYEVPDWIEVTQLDARHRLLASLLQLRRLVTRIAPAATLSFLTRSNIANAVAMAGRGRPWLISERVNTSAHFGVGHGAMAAKAMVRLGYPRASHVIAVSQGVADDLAHNFGVSPSRISVIANPVDHAAIARLAADPPAFQPAGPYIVAAGRLMPNKNFAMLLDAFARARLRARLVIMGEGPERPALEAQARGLGIADRVDMPGFVANPFAVLARAELFALPSNAEGFPNGLVEAMACGLAVVSTNCASGPSEILAGKPREQVPGPLEVDAGMLVPTDDAGAFAEALRSVHREPRRSAAGEAARLRSLAYGVEQAAANYWAKIEEALAPRQRAAAHRRKEETIPGSGVTQ